MRAKQLHTTRNPRLCQASGGSRIQKAQQVELQQWLEYIQALKTDAPRNAIIGAHNNWKSAHEMLIRILERIR